MFCNINGDAQEEVPDSELSTQNVRLKISPIDLNVLKYNV